MVRPLRARRLTPSSPPLLAACLCLLFGGAHAAKPLFNPFTLIKAGQAGEKADAERGLFDGSARGRKGPYMGVPRADLNITRGVDFEGKGSSVQTVMKLTQLRDFLFFEDEFVPQTPRPMGGARETPVALRMAHVLVQMSWNCVARYHPTALEFHTLLPPPDRVTDPSEHTDENRLACIAAAWWHAARELFGGEKDQKLICDYIVDELRIFPQPPKGKPLSALQKVSRVLTLPPSSSLPLDDTRVAAGVEIADDIMAYVRDDGWNADGREGGREGNLRPFQDTTGYRPAPHAGDGLVGANPRRWVPLPETDDRGFFYVQKHVTPQIGSTGRTYLVSEAELANRYTDVPKYNLTAEALDVVRRTAMRLNDTEKMLIELADNKFLYSETMLDPMALRNGWGILEGVFFELASNTGIMDSLVLSWQDKVRNDHVRPTSVVHSFLGDATLQAWKGPGAGQGNLKGHDWQPYIRVMPHSEHPSGSSCICSVLFDVARLTLGRDEWTTVMEWKKGSSVVEPGVTPANDLTWTAQSFTEMEDVCGASRLWGGMHFSGAVPAGKQLCDGLGEMAYRRVSYLVAGDEKFCKEADCSDMQPAFRNPHGSRAEEEEENPLLI